MVLLVSIFVSIWILSSVVLMVICITTQKREMSWWEERQHNLECSKKSCMTHRERRRLNRAKRTKGDDRGNRKTLDR